MSQVLNDAAVVAPPRSGCVQRISATTTAATTAIDADLLKKYITIRSISGDAYVLFGGSAVTVDASATSGATLGKLIAAGEERSFKLEETDTHIACDCLAGTAEVELCKAGK
jgi:hypothetical protein